MASHLLLEKSPSDLSPRTIAIVKSTVPLLRSHGKAITTRFYQLMFQNHPELLNLFNHASQKQGRQQAALASAVYAAAENIDHLAAITPLVNQIAHKHCSLGVQPEQYPIVGSHLLLAIQQVLGEAATDDVIQSWKEAYGVIADLFIQTERDLYRKTEEQVGGWRGFRNFIVTDKVQESCVITSFYLRPEDGKEIPSYEPGQYIGVRVKSEGYTHIRQYSLSDSPGKPYYRISVKREDAVGGKEGGTVSNYIHHRVREGDTIALSAPAGTSTLDRSKQTPVVLLSGGVGVTPLLSMLNTLVEYHPQRNVTFVHAAINGDYHAMRQHVASIASANRQVKSYVCYERPTDQDLLEHRFDRRGYIDAAWLQQIVPTNGADFYICGPIPFMKAMTRAIRSFGVPKAKIHYEFFGPFAELDAA